MFRRMLLASAAVSVLVGGCSTLTSTLAPTIAKVANDLRIIAGGLRSALGNLDGLNIVPSATVAQINVWVSDIDRLATSASMALTVSGAQDIVKQVEVLLNSIVTSLTTFPLPPAVTTALTAASILLPVVGSLIDMVIKPAPALSMPKVGNADEACAYLLAIAGAKK